MTPEAGLEAKTLSKNVSRASESNSVIPKTPVNVNVGERIAEESQLPSCQNTVTRKQYNDAGFFQTPTETPVRKLGQESQIHKLEYLNQPNDLMGLDDTES